MNFIGRFLWLILTIAAISLAMVFAVSNTQQVTCLLYTSDAADDP